MKRNTYFWIFVITSILFSDFLICDQTFGYKAVPSFEKGDILWNQRDDEEKLRACIAFYEEIAAKWPKNEDVFIKLSHACFFLGSYYSIDKMGKKTMFSKGIKAGERAIEINPRSVGGNFWLAVNTGKLGEVKGLVSSAFLVLKLLKFMEIVEQENVTYYYGGYYRFWGKIIYETPKFLMVALGKSIQNKYNKPGGYTKEDQIDILQKAIKIEPNFLMNRIFLASSYIQLKKPEMAKRELENVINTPAGILQKVAPENRYWQSEAKKMLKQINKG